MRRIFLTLIGGLLACTGTVSLGDVPPEPPLPGPTTTRSRAYAIDCAVVGPYGASQTVTLQSDTASAQTVTMADHRVDVSLTPVSAAYSIVTLSAPEGGALHRFVVDQQTAPIGDTFTGDVEAGSGLQYSCRAPNAPTAKAAAAVAIACDFVVHAADGSVEASKHIPLMQPSGDENNFTRSEPGPTFLYSGDVRAALFVGSNQDAFDDYAGEQPLAYFAQVEAVGENTAVSQVIQLNEDARLADGTFSGQGALALSGGRSFTYSCGAP